jgi:H+/gluconate symporter-like permease
MDDSGSVQAVAHFMSGKLGHRRAILAVVTLLAVCGSTHRKTYFDIVIANIVGPIIALAVVIILGSMLGSFWLRRAMHDFASL